jgi:hypothetical protein
MRSGRLTIAWKRRATAEVCLRQLERIALGPECREKTLALMFLLKYQDPRFRAKS